ncbi:MAG: GTP 3',8-cyclase MoaA [Deltaproteobacteria bacterium]|uniref:GTP 3',8-cyclase n=1 Tax=Candidatus Zymogenus saltonus TaxID=2844893 RepID=A0A9D8KCJ4_9DELT|nr:GTP 3',8-cyclase MoaA [Candidatus Zymogenus saltonus]
MINKAGKKPPRDAYRRKIDYLRISVTDRCNLRCTYCMPEEGMPLISHDDIMRFEEIELLVRAAISLGFKKVRLTGGEPLVRRRIVDLVKILGGIEGLKDLSLTTNGVLLRDMAGDLKEAGIGRINISLDTLRRDRFREITRRDLFADVMGGIDEALAVGMDPVKLNVVLIKGVNDDEVIDFIEMTRDRPISVRFIEFMPASRSSDWTMEKIVPSEQIVSEIEKTYPLTPIPEKLGAGPSVDYRAANFRGTIGFITPITNHFCGECNRIRVTSEGKIRSCLFSDEESDILPLLREVKDIDQIAGFILNSLKTKPYRHDINGIRFRNCQRSMSKIGG